MKLQDFRKMRQETENELSTTLNQLKFNLCYIFFKTSHVHIYVCVCVYVMANMIVFVLMGMECQNQKSKEDKLSEKLKIKSKSKFVGVRQRASGKWAAEIKDTSKKIRMWLGTYQTAEEAARAYDEAACLLRGSNARTNFSTTNSGIATNSPVSLKLRNLLDQKAISNQIQNQSSMISSTFLTETSPNGGSSINSVMDLVDNSACSSQGKSLFWVQNQESDNQYELDVNNNMINYSMGIASNTSQFDYSWPLATQRNNNELPIPKDGFNIERQFSDSVYAMNECHVEDTYEYDVNYPLSHFFYFT